MGLFRTIIPRPKIDVPYPLADIESPICESWLGGGDCMRLGCKICFFTCLYSLYLVLFSRDTGGGFSVRFVSRKVTIELSSGHRQNPDTGTETTIQNDIDPYQMLWSVRSIIRVVPFVINERRGVLLRSVIRTGLKTTQ